MVTKAETDEVTPEMLQAAKMTAYWLGCDIHGDPDKFFTAIYRAMRTGRVQGYPDNWSMTDPEKV